MLRKGAIHGYEFIIAKDFTCNDCGNDFDDVDENGLCETCAEFKNISEI